MMDNHSRIESTIAKAVKLNLGGGAEAIVDLHLNEEGYLLIEGIGLDYVDYGVYSHSKDLLEIQLLHPIDYDEE